MLPGASSDRGTTTPGCAAAGPRRRADRVPVVRCQSPVTGQNGMPWSANTPSSSRRPAASVPSPSTSASMLRSSDARAASLRRFGSSASNAPRRFACHACSAAVRASGRTWPASTRRLIRPCARLRSSGQFPSAAARLGPWGARRELDVLVPGPPSGVTGRARRVARRPCRLARG